MTFMHPTRFEMEERLTADLLRQILEYDPNTGLWRDKIPQTRGLRNVRNADGWFAGSKNKKHRYFVLLGYEFPAHRLAWLWMTGEWPEHEIDHVNGDGFDNVWANLREATRSQNQMNRKIGVNNTSGFKGVSFNKKDNRWLASIRVNGKRIYLGLHKTPEEAYAAYVASAKKHFGEYFGQNGVRNV